MTKTELNIILSNFDVNTSKYSYEIINTGYINDSYYIIENGERKYVLQKERPFQRQIQRRAKVARDRSF